MSLFNIPSFALAYPSLPNEDFGEFSEPKVFECVLEKGRISATLNNLH